MNKSELIEQVYTHSGGLSRKEAEKIMTDIICAVDAGERVELRGFGSFFPRQRKARTGRNPKTGERVLVPARRVMFFKSGKELQERLNGKKVAGCTVK
jgi:integration host factor subunit beta